MHRPRPPFETLIPTGGHLGAAADLSERQASDPRAPAPMTAKASTQ
ncbi:MAG: hypothetical protein KA173_06130 [Rhodoferax sp.]|nr:hypothetical protein [Rhodoferax sp.]